MQASVPASVSLALSAPRAASSSRRRSYGRRSYGRSYSRGRSYGRKGGRVGYYQKRAIARKAYIRGRYPSSVYAHPYIARGSAASAALGFTAGAAFKDVPAEEQVARRQAGWYGKGDYAMDGMGDYAVAPRFTGRTLQGGVINLGQNKQMIRQETFFNVMSPLTVGQQAIQEFTVNIGLDEMFPFGSQIANNYRKYKITQLAFTYKNMLAQSLTTTQVGQVTLQWNPDVNEENDTTTTMQALNDQGSVTVNANEDSTIFCEADPARGAQTGFLNVRNKDLRTTQDANDFDFGKLVVTLTGFPSPTGAGAVSNFQIGRLMVSYCVELSHEIINTSMGNAIDQDLFIRPIQPMPAVASTWTGTGFLTPSLVLASENNVGCTLFNASGAGNPFSIQWPSTAFGYYEIIMDIELPETAAPVTIAVPFLETNLVRPILLTSNGTVGPVYDMLNTSQGTFYNSSGVGTNFLLPASAPTGNAIVPPGDPYTYLNWKYGYQLATNVAPAFATGLTARAQFILHVYVPGLGGNSSLPIAGAPGRSPINLTIDFSNSAYFQQWSQWTAAFSQNYMVNARWTLSIKEYNATMRLKLNGTQDIPYLTNQSLVPTIPSSTTW